MNTNKFLITVLFLLFLETGLQAQRGRGHRPHRRSHAGVVVVKRSAYRPARVVVYHPYWRPHYAYNRRWVYFPRYNFYWDNWRNQYVFWNGSTWLSQAAAPPVIVNVNLDKEKTVELKEVEDDDDDIYKTNETHKTEYKED